MNMVYTEMNYYEHNLKLIPILNGTCLREINGIGFKNLD
jgi:quercetin dioxygenase-like cupin family protein